MKTFIEEPIVVEQVRNSHLESNFINHVCNEEDEEEDAVAIENDLSNDLSNELSQLSLLSTVAECHEEEEEEEEEEEDPAATHLLALPTVESSTTYNNFLSSIAGSKYHYRCRWMTSNNDMNDITPILPLRQNIIKPGNTIISTTVSILDRPQDMLPPSNAYTVKRDHAAESKH
jgi:hypothetical protein